MIWVFCTVSSSMISQSFTCWPDVHQWSLTSSSHHPLPQDGGGHAAGPDTRTSGPVSSSLYSQFLGQDGCLICCVQFFRFSVSILKTRQTVLSILFLIFKRGQLISPAFSVLKTSHLLSLAESYLRGVGKRFSLNHHEINTAVWEEGCWWSVVRGWFTWMQAESDKQAACWRDCKTETAWKNAFSNKDQNLTMIWATALMF